MSFKDEALSILAYVESPAMLTCSVGLGTQVPGDFLKMEG